MNVIEHVNWDQLKMNHAKIIGSWKYALLAGFLALILTIIPFDQSFNVVSSQFQASWSLPIAKVLFVAVLFYIIGNSEWFQDL